MKRSCLILLLVVAVNASPASDRPPLAESEIAPKVAAARAILDPWLATNPVPKRKTIHVILWTPADREPIPRYRERLTAVVKDLQAFYAREMTRMGFGPRTFGLDEATDGLVRVHLVRGLQGSTNYIVASGNAIRKECLPTLAAAGIRVEEEHILIFCNLATWSPERRTISHQSPAYGSGTHQRGAAWQVDSPLLDPAFLAEKGRNVTDSQLGELSLGRYNSLVIGGACQELGRAFGLPHCRERDDERAAFGTALMGGGHRTYGEPLRGEGKGPFLTLADGLRLAAHPLFNGSVKGLHRPRSAQPVQLAVRQKGNGFEFSGRVTTEPNEPPVYAVIGYVDPGGGSDYDATTMTTVPDALGQFSLECRAVAPGTTGEVRLVYLQANGVACASGSSTPYHYPYAVAKDGTMDLAPTIVSLHRPIGGEDVRLGAVVTNVPPPVQALAGSEWTLKDLCGTPVPAEFKASLSIGRAGAVSGNAGVNRFTGFVRGGGKTLKAGPFTATRKSGPSEHQALEARYLKSLEAATRFSLAGGNLLVTCAGEAKPLIFTRAKPQ